jgi:hypothetical protein
MHVSVSRFSVSTSPCEAFLNSLSAGDELQAKISAMASSVARSQSHSRASTACMPPALVWLQWQQSSQAQERASGQCASMAQSAASCSRAPSHSGCDKHAATCPNHSVHFMHSDTARASEDAEDLEHENMPFHSQCLVSTEKAARGASACRILERTVAFSELVREYSIDQDVSLLLQGALHALCCSLGSLYGYIRICSV